jgi:hypothetical protein
MHILSEQDIRFFEENGYVVLSGLVPQENLGPVIEATWDFLGMDPDNPEDWYREPLSIDGLVEMYHHQSMWNNRQHPDIYYAFADILGTDKLWVSFDRASLKRPTNPKYPEWDYEGFIHWDIDTSALPTELRVQGVLTLADTDSEQGGFQCVPGMHLGLEEWVKTQPPDQNPFKPDLTGRKIRKVAAKAGDLIIFNARLPHGSSQNRSDKPRFAQYITMFLAEEENAELRQSRIDLWQNRTMPPTYVGDPREIEIQYGTPAILSPLGRKLLGLDRYE